MRHLKKLFVAVMVTLMVFAVAVVPAFADQGTNDNSGSITINDAEPGHTYNAYQILVLESYNTDKDAYSYKASADWADWLAKQSQYVSIDDQGYVTWVKDANAAAFAKAALAHAVANNIKPVDTKTADSATFSFTGLNLGYYLVDTTLGSLCALDTTEPDVEMFEKNEGPTSSRRSRRTPPVTGAMRTLLRSVTPLSSRPPSLPRRAPRATSCTTSCPRA